MRSKILISAVLLMLPLTQSAFAQQGQPVVNPQRDCQTLLTCNYKKGGSYRGCLSSYSCRVCRLVAAPCAPGPSPSQRKCHQMRCSWGA